MKWWHSAHNRYEEGKKEELTWRGEKERFSMYMDGRRAAFRMKRNSERDEKDDYGKEGCERKAEVRLHLRGGFKFLLASPFPTSSS
ncbi:hypothetical protein AAG906_020229 [Vitis piasezkii]